jgi:2'-5' RNA ligase
MTYVLPSTDGDKTAGLFFALFPPPAIAARIAELGRQLRSVHRLEGAPTAMDRLHCTLYPVDLRRREPGAAMTRACAAAARIRTAPFDVVFDRTLSFRGSGTHPFVLAGDHGLAALSAFRHALGTALYHAELRDGASSFTPHVTLLYGGDKLIDERPVSPIRWRVEDFRLILSTHGEGHAVMGCWPLSD